MFTAAFFSSMALLSDVSGIFFLSFFSSEKQLNLYEEQHYRNVTF